MDGADRLKGRPGRLKQDAEDWKAKPTAPDRVESKSEKSSRHAKSDEASKGLTCRPGERHKEKRG